MTKFFRTIAGAKFYCDSKGVLAKTAEGRFKEVEEDDTEAAEVEQTEEGQEVENMLRDAMKQVRALEESNMDEAGIKAAKAVKGMFDSIEEAATKGTLKIATASGIKASFDVDEVKKGIADLSDSKRKSFTFTINSVRELDFLSKAVSEGDSLTGDVIEGQREPEITRDPTRAVFIESIANTVDITTDHLSYVECVNESGAPLPTAELDTIPEKDFEFQEFKAYLKKIAVINKHSVEILKDAPQLVAAIKGWLQEDVNIVTDAQLLTGNGSGDNLTGVFHVASVLDAAAVGTKRVAHANLYDALRVALTKVAVTGKGKFLANYALLNPDDADALDLTKDENGQYILPPFRSADGTTIKGARVIENVGIPAGKFLVGDFRKFHVGRGGGVEIEMTDSDGTDFAKDILSVKVRVRRASYVRTNDNGAFWTGDISDVIDALTAS